MRDVLRYLLPAILTFSGFAAAAHAAGPIKEDCILYRNEGQYAAFPSLYQDGDRLWVTFGWNTTRSHYGKAAGGQTGSVQLFSPDAGKTWLQKGKDSSFQDVPANKRELKMADGTLISIGPMMHEVLPGDRKEELVRRGVDVKQWPDGHISASYRVRMSRQVPGGPRRSSEPALPAFASMGGFGFGIVTSKDVVLKPVYGLADLKDPATRAWVLRSTDRGETWQLVTMAYDGIHSFNEADLLALPDGRVLAMIRAESGRGRGPMYDRGFLWQTESADGGLTWTPPRRTPMWGFPPTLLRLADGRILCSYGYRRPPYGIRACLSSDGGRTWDTANEVLLRVDALGAGPSAGKGTTSDLGYPRSVQLADGTIFTVYYITLADGVTHVAASQWSLDYRGPADEPRGEAAIPQSRPDPSLPPERILGETGPRKFDYGLMQTFIATQPRLAMVAVRVSARSGEKDLIHTNGLYVAIRKPDGSQWWTRAMGSSKPLRPEEVKIGGWNAFVFEKPVDLVPGETYALTIYNLDFLGGPTRIKPGLTGDHGWYLNTSEGVKGDYPNGSISPEEVTDLAFKVYGERGPLPAK